MLWGQSLGAGVATTAAAAYLAQPSSTEGITLESETKRIEIKGLLLETPYTSVRAMLLAFYLQKWLRYRYLYHSLWDHWNRRQTVSQIATSGKPKVLILQAGEDELVPRAHCSELQGVCQAGRMDVERIVVKGA